MIVDPTGIKYIERAVRAAAECLQWQASDASNNGHGYPISDGGDEYTDDVVDKVPYLTEAVTAFVTDNADDLAGMTPEQCGHDFILTANGHGAGFWDRGLGERGGRLTEATCGYSLDAEFALDEDGDVSWLMVENTVIVANSYYTDEV